MMDAKSNAQRVGECCAAGKESSSATQPVGAIQTIGPLNTYCALPSASDSAGILLLLPDGFGLVQHNFILADQFAAHGWHVIVPDYYEGDALPLEFLRRDPGLSIDEHDWPEEAKDRLRNVDLVEWGKRHPHDRVESLLRVLIDSIKTMYADKNIFAVGYCFGGKHAIRLSSWAVKAAVAFHPSFVTEDDTEVITVPLLVGYAEKDQMVSPTLVEDLNGWLEGRGVCFEYRVYPDMNHGFAARPDTEDLRIKEQYLAAFEDAIGFLKKHK